jgi:hypothetical protein
MLLKAEQIEELNISDNILCNLSPEEKIIYTLKIKYYRLIQKFWILILLGFSTLSISLLFFFILPNLFKNFVLIKAFIIILIPLVIFFLYKMLKPLEFSIYISNKKIYLIGEISPMVNIANIIEIASLQFMSLYYSDYFNDIGRIEFTNINYKNDKKIIRKKRVYTPNIKNLSRVLQIIESIICYFGDLNNKIELIERKKNIHNYLTYFCSKDNSYLQIYDDKIIFLQGTYKQNFNFSTNLNLTYKENTIILHLINEGVKKVVKFGPIENYKEILELIYLKNLSWKYNENLLLDIEDLITLQKRHEIYLYKEGINNMKVDLEPVDYSKKRLKKFFKFLNKDEEILLIHFPKKRNSLITSFLIFFLVTVYLYFVIFSIINLSISNLLMFFGICSLFLLFILFYLFEKERNYVFTSQKIMIQDLKKIYCIPYDNTLAVTYFNKIMKQEINIHLKKPLDGLNLNDETKIEFYSPRKSQLFIKILGIIKLYNKRN